MVRHLQRSNRNGTFRHRLCSQYPVTDTLAVGSNSADESEGARQQERQGGFKVFAGLQSASRDTGHLPC